MKAKRCFFKMLPLLFLGTIIFGCQKEGPQGPKGPIGQQGPQGPSATAKTYTFDIPLSSFNFISTNKSYEVSANNHAPSGFSVGPYDDVSLYIYETNGWYALPYIEYSANSSVFTQHYYQLDDNRRLWIMIRNSLGGTPYSNMMMTPPTSLSYRAVVIPGQYGMKPQRPEDVDFDNYVEVKNYYNLPD